MLKYLAIGGSLAFVAAVQPGPFQAYLLSRVTATGWRRTLPAALAPLLSDGPIALLALLVLGRLSLGVQSILRLAGGAFLLYLAWGAYQQWRRDDSQPSEQAEKVPKTLIEAALVNLLNPNPYLGWTLILGPTVIAAWQEAPSSGVAVVVAFYATMVTTLAALIVLFGSAHFLGARFQRVLMFVSVWILAGLGFYQLAKSVQYFGAA